MRENDVASLSAGFIWPEWMALPFPPLLSPEKQHISVFCISLGYFREDEPKLPRLWFANLQFILSPAETLRKNRKDACLTG